MTEQAAATAQTSPAPPRKRSKNKVKWIKRIIAIVVILALVLGIGFGMWYMVFRDDGAVGAPLTDVSRIGNIQSVVQGYGNAMPKETAAITLTAGGTVQAVYVTQGQTVFAGDPLYTIDSQAARDKVTEAEKGVATAEENVTAAERAVVDAERAVTDAEKGITTAEKGVTEAEKGVETAEKGVETAQKAVTTAEKGVETAQKAVATAEKGVTTAEKGVTDAEKGVATAQEGVKTAQNKVEQLKKELAEIKARTTSLSVRAPFSGKLTDVKSFTVGQQVNKGESIATLVNDKKLTIPFYFSYAYEDDIYVGQKVSVSIPSVMRDLTGSVEKINKISYISPEGGIHFEAVVAIDNPGTLTEGMEASASISANGSVLYPYAMGKTAFYEVQEVTAKESGPVVSVGSLMDYTSVSSGTVLLTLGTDDLDKEISAKNDEIAVAEEAVETAKERVEQAQENVENAKEAVETAKERVEQAKEGVEQAEEGVEQAKEGVEQAKEAVVRAQENVETAKEGVETAVLNVERAKEDVVKAQENVVKAQEKVLEAQEEVVKAQEGLDNFDAVAPIDGTIFSCTLSEGQEVKEGETVITISNTTTMLVDIQVDSRNIGFIQAGMMMELTDDWGNPVMGTVTNIAMEGDVGTGTTTYPVQLEVDNFMGTIYNGSWLNYKLVTSESTDCVLIPNQCVKRVNDVNGDIYTVVFIQSDFQPDNAIEMDETMLGTALPTPAEGFWPIPVTTGISDTYNVEIVEGLDAGVEVFTNRETNSASIW